MSCNHDNRFKKYGRCLACALARESREVEASKKVRQALVRRIGLLEQQLKAFTDVVKRCNGKLEDCGAVTYDQYLNGECPDCD